MSWLGENRLEREPLKLHWPLSRRCSARARWLLLHRLITGFSLQRASATFWARW